MALGAFTVGPQAGDPRGMEFLKLGTWQGEIPDDQSQIVLQVQEMLRVIDQLFPKQDDRKFSDYYQSLLSIAQFGLVGNNAQPAFAARLLQSLRLEIVNREAGRVKNQYLRQLGFCALCTSVFFWLLALGMTYISNQSVPAMFCVVLAASQLGVWLSFGIRKVEYTFEDLTLPEKDRLAPFIRLMFTAGLALVLTLAFFTGLVTVTLGGFSSANFTESMATAILLGSLLGVSELALGGRVARHATQLIDSSAAK